MICNFMIFSESVGSGACLSAKGCKSSYYLIYILFSLYLLYPSKTCLYHPIAFENNSYLLPFLRIIITFLTINIMPIKIKGILNNCPILKNKESSKPF